MNTSKPQQRKTSTPNKSSVDTFTEPDFSVSNISNESTCSSELDSMFNKRAVSKVTEQLT